MDDPKVQQEAPLPLNYASSAGAKGGLRWLRWLQIGALALALGTLIIWLGKVFPICKELL